MAGLVQRVWGSGERAVGHEQQGMEGGGGGGGKLGWRPRRTLPTLVCAPVVLRPRLAYTFGKSGPPSVCWARECGCMASVARTARRWLNRALPCFHRPQHRKPAWKWTAGEFQ